MAQMRMPQPGMMPPPHQQRPPMMVSMTQPPPVSMQGMVSMAPMMGHAGGGMAGMSSLSHPDNVMGPDHMSPSYHSHHHHHGGPPPPHHHGGPTAGGPPQYHSHHHIAGPHHMHGPHNHQGIPSGPHMGQQHRGGGHFNGPRMGQGMGGHMSHGGPPTHMMSQQPHIHHSGPPMQMANMSNSGPSSMGPPTPGSGHPQVYPQHRAQPSHQHHSPYQVPSTPTPYDNMSMQSFSHGPNVQPSQPSVPHPKPPDQTNSSGDSNGGSLQNGSSSPVLCSPLPLSNESGGTNKEKTPMCLVNELARYNKIQHQYCLTDEKGPAHKKMFAVKLRLGDTEEYTASGASIKKAQHAAAEIALEKTQFKHPPPKILKANKQTKLTPTVELNALAMKRGEPTVYSFMEVPHQPNPYMFNMPPNIRAMYNQKYFGRPPMYPVFFVTLRVGSREFVGEGVSAQQAKHNAASKALKTMKSLPMPESASCGVGKVGDLTDLDPNAELKSPISLVHEVALKHNLTVTFEVTRESGPPHMRTFITLCLVGEYRTEGEGAGKKVSKKRAAEMMLEELRKLPSVSPPLTARVKRKPTLKKKGRNLIKVGQEEQKATPEYGQGVNPISRLIQIQQAKKEKEPVYTLVAERGVPRRREFVVQVTVGSESAQGTGPNKKLAKRAAAENMLQQMGYSRPQPQPGKPAIKTDASHETDKSRKVTFLENVCEESSVSSSSTGGSNIVTGTGRQLVPGLIMMPEGTGYHGCQQQSQPDNSSHNSSSVNLEATSAIAKEILRSGISNSIDSTFKTCNGTSTAHATPVPLPQSVNLQQPPPPMTVLKPPSVVVAQSTTTVSQCSLPLESTASTTSVPMAVRPKDQLVYLAQILNIQVNFVDFPKGKSEYLSLVSLATVPPHVSHGVGPNIEASQDEACLNALNNLAELGLDAVTGKSEQ